MSAIATKPAHHLRWLGTQIWHEMERKQVPHTTTTWLEEQTPVYAHAGGHEDVYEGPIPRHEGKVRRDIERRKCTKDN